MAYEHRLVVWERGERLKRGWWGHHVDHRDGDKLNNADENLVRMTYTRHNHKSQLERKEKRCSTMNSNP